MIKFKKEILIGHFGSEYLVAQMECNGEHFTITGHTYDDDFFTEEEGEEQAREYLEDGDSWRWAVQAGHTTLGLDEWIDEVLSIDGWAEVLGDIVDIGGGTYTRNLEGIYTKLLSCGCLHDFYKGNPHDDENNTIILTREEIEIINQAVNGRSVRTKPLHLKPFKTYTQGDKALIKKVKAIFDKYPEFELSQLKGEIFRGEEL